MEGNLEEIGRIFKQSVPQIKKTEVLCTDVKPGTAPNECMNNRSCRADYQGLLEKIPTISLLPQCEKGDRVLSGGIFASPLGTMNDSDLRTDFRKILGGGTWR